MYGETRRLARSLQRHVESLAGFGVTAVPMTSDPVAKWPSGQDTTCRASVREERLARLANEVERCRRCPLYQTRTRAVISDGTPQARLVFVGEAPGRDEDLQGIPFVGAAGRLLTKMILAMGMRREEVYICNVLKDRPPGNRTPLPEEISACLPFLREQLAVVKPRVICALGAVATKTLLGASVSLTNLRGQVLRYGDTPLVPTFHPAYLLRNPAAKRLVWEDLKTVKRLLR